MTPILTFAQTTTYDLTPAGVRLPSFFWTAFTALNKVHAAWRWYRKADLYTNPNNLSQLLAGHLINFAIGDTLMLRIAAQCLLIATRILECVQQQTILYRSGLDLVGSLHGQYPKPHKRPWKRLHDNVWTSPSSSGWLNAKCRISWNYAERIIKCVAAIFMHAFKLSMLVMDAIDTFTLSPYSINEGINEFFVNSMKWMTSLVENKQALLDGIESNKGIILKILEKSPITYIQLHASVKKTLEKTEDIHSVAEKVSNFGNGVLIEFGRRMWEGVKVVTGIHKLI